jgi:hypothetical protein
MVLLVEPAGVAAVPAGVVTEVAVAAAAVQAEEAAVLAVQGATELTPPQSLAAAAAALAVPQINS